MKRGLLLSVVTAAAYRTSAKYKGYPATPNPQFGGAKANIQVIYNELKK